MLVHGYMLCGTSALLLFEAGVSLPISLYFRGCSKKLADLRLYCAKFSNFSKVSCLLPMCLDIASVLYSPMRLHMRLYYFSLRFVISSVRVAQHIAVL